VISLLALAMMAAEPPEPPLLPIPSVLRPRRKAEEPGPRTAVGACKDGALPVKAGSLPFGPGEKLSFDVTLLGIRTGKIHLEVDPRERRDGTWAYPLRATAKTESLFSVLGSLDGKMISWLDVGDLKPARMVNHFVVERFAKPKVIAREDAAFAGDGQVAARLAYTREGTTKVAPAKLQSRAELLDVLSVVYAMRARAYVPGERYCFEVYHRRRLWRVEGEVGAVELARSPYTTRRAWKVAGKLRQVGSPAKARPVTTWVSADDDRLPLRVKTPDVIGDLEVQLTRFRPGRRLRRR
jgi:hypothetical protein